MLPLGGFVIVLSGYVSFAARREGASFQRALLGGALSAAVLQSIVTGGTVWLEGVAIIELAMTIWALACVASALAGAFGLKPHRRRVQAQCPGCRLKRLSKRGEAIALAATALAQP
jgi:hypothetical protein